MQPGLAEGCLSHVHSLRGLVLVLLKALLARRRHAGCLVRDMGGIEAMS